MLYDIFSGVIIVLAGVGMFQMIRLAINHPRARLPFSLVAFFCFYAAAFYFWMLIYSPTIGITTATGGRVLVIFLVSAVVMLGTLMDK
jgi:hypothetical protein